LRRISIEALNSSPGELLRLRGELGRGEIAAVPTETYYGFAADPWSESGVQRVVEAKGRESVKALPVLVADREQLERLGVTASPETLEPFLRLWPAPLTVVLPIQRPLAASRGAMTLAVRIPAEPRLRRMLSSVGPVTATSANRSGAPPLDDPDAVASIFRSAIGVLVDGGRTPGGEPSTLLDATKDPPLVLRAGAFEWRGGRTRADG
jgi:L-threonylcarbamoyladenylate synthase